mgnify:CR=1 FL=1
MDQTRNHVRLTANENQDKFEVERAEEARVEGEGRRLVKEKVGDLVEETRAVDVEGGNTTAQAETISVKVEKKNPKEERDGACGEVFGGEDGGGPLGCVV